MTAHSVPLGCTESFRWRQSRTTLTKLDLAVIGVQIRSGLVVNVDRLSADLNR
jgi:hypothetical protein